MATETESIAAGNAIPVPADPYSPENLMSYHISLSLVESLVKRGILTQADYAKSCRVLTRKYGLSPDSIFAEIA